MQKRYFLMLLSIVLFVCGLLVLPASAAFIDSDPYLTPSNGQNIISLDYSFDGSSHTFTMTLEGVPSGLDFASIYGIYIDSGIGGTTTDHPYVPQMETAAGLVTLTGIDKILDTHYISSNNTWERNEYHFGYNNNNGLFEFAAIASSSGGFSTNQVAGAQPGVVDLVWEIDESLIYIGTFGTDFTFYGGTITESSGGATTHDFAAVPLPGALVLLGSGLIGLVGLRRKNSTT